MPKTMVLLSRGFLWHSGVHKTTTSLPAKQTCRFSTTGDLCVPHFSNVGPDVWSAGCVLAELLLGQPIFPGDSGVDQLVEIIKVLGTPSREQIREMNPNYTEFKFPQIKAHPWTKVFRPRTPPEAIQLVSRLLEYTPVARISPLEACAHPFFDELRDSSTRLPNARELPPLFNFTPQELLIQPSLNTVLVPSHARPQSTEDPAATSQQSSPDNPAPSTEVPPQGATAAGSTA